MALAQWSPPNIALPPTFSFFDLFTTIHCTRKLVFSAQLAKRLRDGRHRKGGVAPYEVHRLGETNTDRSHKCTSLTKKCSTNLKSDLIEFKPHPRTPNSLISYVHENHVQVFRMAVDHVLKCTIHPTKPAPDQEIVNSIRSVPCLNGITRSFNPLLAVGQVCHGEAAASREFPYRACIDCLEHMGNVIVANLPTSYQYAVSKLIVRILGPPECIGDKSQPNQLYLEHDDEAHMRFQARESQPMTTLLP